MNQPEIEAYIRLIILLPAAVFASYGLTYTIVYKDGPADLLLKFRVFLGAYDYAENGMARTSLGRLIGCPYCVGVWVALGLALVLFNQDIHWPLYWWTIVGGQFKLQKGRRRE